MTGVIIAAVVVTLLFFIGALAVCIKKIPPGMAGVRVAIGRGFTMSDEWLFRIPLLTRFELMDISVRKLEIERKGQDGLICEDNIRADIVVAFYIKVNYPTVDYGGHHQDSEQGKELFDAAMKSGGQAKYQDIRKVAQTVGCERASDVEKLRELFEAKFSEALKTAGKQMEFETLYTERTKFRDAMIEVIGKDLSGYALEDVAIDYLEQTPIETLDNNNVLDAQGIEKITRMTSDRQEATNLREMEKAERLNDQNRIAEAAINAKDQETEVQITEQNEAAAVEKKERIIDSTISQRELDKRNLSDEADQKRNVEIAASDAEKETAVQVAQNRKDVEVENRKTDKEVKVFHEESRSSEVQAEFGVEQSIKREEQETIKAEQMASLEREELVGLQEQDKNAKVIERSLDVEVQRANLEGKKKTTAEEVQNVLDVEKKRAAERDKEVILIDAERDARANQVEKVVAAETEVESQLKLADMEKQRAVIDAEGQLAAEEQLAEKIRVAATGRAKAMEQDQLAMVREADGQKALLAKEGLAEAEVMTAKAGAEKAMGLAEAAVRTEKGKAEGSARADEGKGEAEADTAKAKAIEATGLAEGKSIEAKGLAEGKTIEAKGLAEGKSVEAVALAEALGKSEMAKANELFKQAGQGHEEFRMQLDKDKEVELADINIKKDVAEAQARVLGEALKSANIDLVGGEQDFFDRVVASVSQGKVVDRLVGSSQTITDVKNTFFNGDPDYFKSQLTGWIKSVGLSSEDVKNLTVSAVLASLISRTDDNAVRGLMRQVQKAVKGTELGSTLASAWFGEKKADN